MSIENVLVATDMERQSVSALLRAVQLAQHAGAILHVLHVARRSAQDHDPAAVARDDEIIAEIRELASTHTTTDVECVVHLEQHGRIHEKIAEYSRSVSASLLVLGRSKRAEILPDSVLLTTGQVVANVHVPVLVVTQPISADYQNVLLEVEMGESPAGLLKVISKFGPDIRLTLLVSTYSDSQLPGFVSGLVSTVRRRMQQEYIDTLRAHARESAIDESRISIELVPEDYVSTLTAKLVDSRFDVIGLTRMDKRLRHRESGKHMIGALQAANCDILIDLQ